MCNMAFRLHPKWEKPPSVDGDPACRKVFSFRNQMQAKRKDTLLGAFPMLALPIFPGASARQVSWAKASLADLSRDGHPSQAISTNQSWAKRKDTLLGAFPMLALPIFPGRLQPSIVGRSKINWPVTGWPPIPSYLYKSKLSKKKRHPIGCLLYVGATYFSGPSPAKYRGQKRA